MCYDQGHIRTLLYVYRECVGVYFRESDVLQKDRSLYYGLRALIRAGKHKQT